MSQKLNQQGLDYVEKSGAALQAAEEIVAEVQAEKQAAAELIPAVVERLGSMGLLPDHQKQACTVQLGSHRDTMEILGNVLDECAEKISATKQAAAVKTASELGSPSDESDSGVLSGGIDKFANQPGRRRGNDDPLAESDRAFAQGLGVTLNR